MNRQINTWVVRMSNGQIKGPYSTETIAKLINEGIIAGSEWISKVPNGQWILVSQEPEFYDKLLDAIENVVQVNPAKANKIDEKTVTMTRAGAITPEEEIKKKNKEAIQSALQDAEKKGPSPGPSIQPASTSLRTSLPPQNNEIIELRDVDSMKSKMLLKKMMVPLAFLLLASLALVYVLLEEPGAKEDKISLIAPKVNTGVTLSDAQIKEKVSLAVRAIEADTYEAYMNAQNILVSVVEGANTHLEARGLLCLVYKELWPFAKQDIADQKVITYVTQTTKALNIISPYGQVCELMKFIVSGKYKETKGLVESMLDKGEQFSLLPILYYVKAENLEGDRDYINAAPYYEKAFTVWPGWMKPMSDLGAMHYRNKMNKEGYLLFKKIYERFPQHKKMLIYIGLYEYFAYRRSDSAFDFLNSAIKLSSKVDRTIDAEAHRVLAEIYIEKNNKKMALQLAQKAQKLHPTDLDIKQLIVRLGGAVSTPKEIANNELMYVGDQYARQGDWLAAQAEFKAAFEANPRNGIAAVKAAKALWQLNQSQDAVFWLKKAIKAEPKLLQSYVLITDYLTLQYDFAQAQQIMMSAMKIDPNNYEVLRGFALLEYRRNNMIGAINYAQRSLHVYDGEIETYVLLAKASRDLALSIVSNSKVEIEKKQSAIRDAVRFSTKAVEIDSSNVEAQTTYANILAITSGVDVGTSYLNDLINKYSFTYEYRMAIADLYKAEERHAQAQKIYKLITDIDAKNKKAWIGLGQTEHALGYPDKAMKAFLKAALLDPNDVEALIFVGRLYLEKNQFVEAIQQFRSAQRTNPFYPKTYYYIGKTALASGDYQTALEAAMKEKNANPNMADAYVLLAEIYQAQHSYSECALAYAQALKLRSQETGIYVKSAKCYRLSGSIDMAENMLELAISQQSGYAEIYREQGAIYEQRGESRAAVVAYGKYLDLSPNAPDRADIERRISNLER